MTKKVGLVLGAGGIAGFAYLTTALSVLQQLTGWDPRNAEVIVGTSAGSNMGGFLRGGTPIGESLDDIMTLPANPRSMERLRELSGREADRTTRLFPTSLKMAVRETARGPFMRPSRLISGLLPNGNIRTDTIGDRMFELHGSDWPEEDLYIAAVRLQDSERVVFGRDRTDIAVGTAVEASSAIPGYFRPVTIDSFRYIDGGTHSPTNADLLADRDLDLIVIVAPMSVDSYSNGWMTTNGALRLFWRSQVQREVAELEALGHTVLLLEPSIDEARSMGPTMMDPTRIVNVVLQTSSAARSAITDEKFDSQLAILRAAATAAS
ncbi:MAG: patatin-like phospholipase family protein [Acidimicrobiia bacterium]|nr:patatin-like phospholipase family protein [Acidimicrobiia bacterium]